MDTALNGRAALSTGTYHGELTSAMAMLGGQPNVVFMGQGVACPSTSMSSTFRYVPLPKRLEMPVAEELQMGMATGMAIGGLLPVCVFPRWNFLLRGMSALVNELDRIPIYSNGGYRPKVIVRVAVPSTSPFNPQSQHDDDFTDALKMMLRTVHVVTLETAAEIVGAYERALDAGRSTILVEYAAAYREARATER